MVLDQQIISYHGWKVDLEKTKNLIHKMLDDDHGEGVHNHLCPYITIILKGGYWETTKKGKFWRPLDTLVLGLLIICTELT